MRITQEELLRRLNNPNNLVNKLPSKKGNDADNRNNAGRKPDLPNAPKSLRVVAGVLSKIDNGVAASHATGLTNGQARYAAKQVETKLTVKHVEEIALTRLMDALGLITPESMEGEKPKDLSIIAANLSRVHRNVSADSRTSSETQVNVTIYAPKQRTLSDFESIEVCTGT